MYNKRHFFLKRLPFYIILIAVLLGIRYYKHKQAQKKLSTHTENKSQKPMVSPTALIGSRDEKYDTEEKIKEFFKKIHVEYSNHSRFSEKCKDLQYAKKEEYLDYSKKKEYYDKIEKQYDDFVSVGFVAPIYIKWVSDEIGYGVYALQDIPKDKLISEYVGEIIYKEDISNKVWSWKYPSHGRFIEKYPQNLSINSAHYGNETRFINHDFNVEKQTPNVKTVFCYVNNSWRLLYIAKRYINKDEEVVVNYGPKYWRRRNLKKNL